MPANEDGPTKNDPRQNAITIGSLHDGLGPARPVIDDLPAGTILGGYRLREPLGEGGMGRVYVAEHVKLGRKVALKILRDELACNPTAVSRFFAEARAVTRISHDNIVAVTDFVETPRSCFVMELLHGEDLGLRLLRERFPLAAVVDIGVQIASGLAAVHAAGIVHRDLKPDNIFLIDRSPAHPYFVKLLDFGVAKLIGEEGIAMHSTAAGQILGTPEYMSPEQACGLRVDHRTDIYALGVILYQLLCGSVPFQAAHFGDLIVQQMTSRPLRPKLHGGRLTDIPDELDDLVMALLSKHLETRPRSMREIEIHLRDLQPRLGPVPPRASGSVVRPPVDSGPFRRQTPPAEVFATAETIDVKPTAATTDRSRVTTPPPGIPVIRAAPASVDIPPVSGELDVCSRPAWASGSLVDVVAVPPAAASAEPATPRLDARPARRRIARSVAALFAAAVLGGVIARHRTADVAAAPVAAHVRIKLTSKPSGAVVRIAGTQTVLGTTPFVTAVPRDRVDVIEVAKPGFVTATEPLDLESDGTLSIILAPSER